MHERIRERLPDYASGSIDAEAGRELEAHLATCPDCRAELAEWQALAGALAREVAGRVEVAPEWLPPEASVAGSGASGPAGRPWLVLLLLLGLGASLITLGWRDGRPRIGFEATRERGLPVAEPGFEIGSEDPDAGGASTTSAHIPSRDPRAIIPRLPTPVARRGAVSSSERPLRQDARSGRPDAESVGQREAQAWSRVTAEPPTRLALGGDPSVVPTLTATTQATSGPDPAAGVPTATAPSRGAPTERPDPPATRARETPLPAPSATPIVMPTLAASPTAPTTAWLRGRVHGPDGFPRAEIPVIAEAFEEDGASFQAVTDVEGRYALELPPGRWLLHVEAPAYQLMWHAGAANPLGADAIGLVAGDQRQADFYLEPHPAGRVEGRVLDAEGEPAERVLVLAAYPPDPQAPGDPPRLVWAVFTDADGRFALALPPGAWYLAAMADWRRDAPSWWGGNGSLDQADRLGVPRQGSVAVTVTLRP